MSSAVLEQVRDSNGKLRGMLRRVGEALAGRANFGVEEVREIAEPVADMAPVVMEAGKLRAESPELRNELEQYAKNLGELNQGLEQMHYVLLARCASIEAQRGHLESVRMWVSTWQQTQPSRR